MTKPRIAVVLAAVLLGLALVRGAQAAAGWQDMGQVDDVRVYLLRNGNDRCYLTVPAGGISCVR